MNTIHQNKIILGLSLPLCFLITIVSNISLCTPDFYSAETLNWQAQSIGQDMIDLILIMPCLFITSVLANRSNKKAKMIWGGVVLYLTYTFTLYCFDVHFNQLFILYCLCLGLSFYALLYFLFTEQNKAGTAHIENKRVIRVIGIYFIIISVLFYVLWLSEIIPSVIQNTTPKSIEETGLFTNGVHILDLAVILPAIFLTGIFLLKQKPLGYILTPVILTFFILMDITIGTLVIVMKAKGLESDLILSPIMGLLALVSLILLFWYLKNTKTASNG